MSKLFALGGQSIGASFLALVLQVNIQNWFPLGLTALEHQAKVGSTFVNQPQQSHNITAPHWIN